jgi:hypothetical protein
VSLTLEESSRLAGGHHWIECRMFEVLGGWVATTSEPDAKLMFDRHSRHHAWRAEQWRDRLPVLADVDRDGLSVPPSVAAASALEALAGLPGTVERVAGAYRVVLPRLSGAYLEHLSLASPVSDGSAMRTLNMLVADVGTDWREGELLLQRLIGDEAAVRTAADTVVLLEGAFVGGSA